MTEYTKVVPCTIKFTHNPAEKASATEPGVDEDFILESVLLDTVDIGEYLDCYRWEELEDSIYEYLKGNSDE